MKPEAPPGLPARTTLLFICLAAAVVEACGAGPRALRSSRSEYNEAVRVTAAEELLLNIVRLRYSDSPEFLGVGTITSQFSFSVGLGVTAGTSGGDAEVLGTGNVGFTESPTITFTPRDDTEFVTHLLTPVSLKGIVHLVINGSQMDRVLRMSVRSLNGLDNFGSPDALTPEQVSEFTRFVRVAQAFDRLWDQGLIEVAERSTPTPISSPIPAAAVSGSDVVAAAEQGYRFRTRDGGASFVLVRDETTTVLRFDPDALGTEEARTIFQALDLRPGATEFEIVLAIEGQFSGAETGGRTQLSVSTRSVLSAMAFLSYGVKVPERHLEAGVARQAMTEAGDPVDTKALFGDLFTVRSGTSNPPEAAVRAEYRGHWFYIDDRDRSSKETFALLQDLFRLEVSGEEAVQAPVLTLPVAR